MKWDVKMRLRSSTLPQLHSVVIFWLKQNQVWSEHVQLHFHLFTKPTNSNINQVTNKWQVHKNQVSLSFRHSYYEPLTHEVPPTSHPAFVHLRPAAGRPTQRAPYPAGQRRPCRGRRGRGGTGGGGRWWCGHRCIRSLQQLSWRWCRFFLENHVPMEKNNAMFDCQRVLALGRLQWTQDSNW